MHILRAPRLNANDDTVTLVEWLKAPGTFVTAGEAVCVVETTKAVVEVSAEQAGHLRPIAPTGAEVAVGAPLGALTATPDEPVEIAPPPTAEQPRHRGGATRKAQITAGRLGVDLAALAARMPEGARITEADVQAAATATEQTEGDLVDDVYTSGRAERVLVIGAGRAAVQVIDAIHRRSDQRAVAIVDDRRPAGVSVMGVPVLGGVSLTQRLHEEGGFDRAIAALGTVQARREAHEALQALGVAFTNVIDPGALIASNVRLGDGNFISAGARLGPCVTLGDGNYLSAMCSIEHHNVVGSYCHFGPGVVTSGSVHIGDRVLFGTGIHIEPDLSVGDDCVVASGVTLTQSVPPRCAVKAVGSATVRPL